MLRLSRSLLVLVIGTTMIIGSLSAEARAATRSATAQQGNSIGGNILDRLRRPVTNVQVELLNENEAITKRTRTDGVGRYLFTGLAAGNYYVRVQTVGTNFVSQTVRIEIINVSIAGGGRSYEDVSFVLKTNTEEKSGNVSESSSVVFYQEVPDNARKIYEAAIEKLDSSKETDAAIEELKKAIQIFPTYYMALERLGMEYTKQNQYDQASQILHKAVEVNPKGHMSYYSLGIAQYNLKRMDEAVYSLKQAVSLVPNSANSQFWLGIALFRSGRLQEAEVPFKHAYELAGKEIPDVHMYLAQIYSNTKRYKEAADELDLFLKEAPNAKDTQNIKNIITQLRAKAKQ